MSKIIAAKYGGPCIKCGKKIKAGSFVNWDRGRGIWHLDETNNKKLGSSMLDPTAHETGDSCHSDTHHGEEKIMHSSDNDNTINESVALLIESLTKVLKDATAVEAQEAAVEVAEPPAEKERQLPVRDIKIEGNPGKHTEAILGAHETVLTDKQVSFCELMALGSSRADAYTNSYDVATPAFSNNAARKLLRQEKIRNRIAEFNAELNESVETADTRVVDWKGAKRGWTVKLTEKQERFCQAMASGNTIVDAFKKSGYHLANWTSNRTRKRAHELIKLPKIKSRIADIASGHAPDIKVIVAGEDSHIAPRTGTGPTSKTKVGAISMPDLAELNEFVDNFVELIKAHGRLFHHAVVTRGQREVGIPGANVEEVEEAVYRSIETLRETLSEKLLIPRAKINSLDLREEEL